MKQKILFVLFRSPYPATDGTRQRILNEIQALSSDFEVSLLLITDEKISTQNKEFLNGIINGNVYIFSSSKINCYIRSFLGIFSLYPLQSNYFFNRKALKWLKLYNSEYKVIHFHTLRFGRYITSLKKVTTSTRLLLCFNDAISLNYRDAIHKAKGFWKLIYKIEFNRVKKYELTMLTTADGFSIVSHRDIDWITENWHKTYGKRLMPHIHLISNWIEDNIFEYNYMPENNNLVFIGNLFYPPNRQGLLFFCKNIWPAILRRESRIKLIIIGRGGREFFKNIPNVEIAGFVDDPYELMIRQAAFISPANFGAGIPTKSLFAMALGLPVISTIDNAKGIDGILDNKNIYLIDYEKIDSAAEKIHVILKNKEGRIAVGLAGKRLIKDNYRKSIIYPLLKTFIEEEGENILND